MRVHDNHKTITVQLTKMEQQTMAKAAVIVRALRRQGSRLAAEAYVPLQQLASVIDGKIELPSDEEGDDDEAA